MVLPHIETACVRPFYDACTFITAGYVRLFSVSLSNCSRKLYILMERAMA